VFTLHASTLLTVRACHVDDQDERSISSHLLRAGDLLRFVLPRQRDPGHRRHGVRRLPQTGSARGRRRRTGACVSSAVASPACAAARAAQGYVKLFIAHKMT